MHMFRLLLVCAFYAQYAVGLPICEQSDSPLCLAFAHNVARAAAVSTNPGLSLSPQHISPRAKISGIGGGNKNTNPVSGPSRQPGSNNPNAPEGEGSNAPSQNSPEDYNAGSQHDEDFFETTANDINAGELQRLDNILPLNGLTRKDLGQAMLSGRKVRADHMSGATKKTQDEPFIDYEPLERVGLQRDPEDPNDISFQAVDAQGRVIFHRTIIRDRENPNPDAFDSQYDMPFEFHVSPERGQFDVNKGFTNYQLRDANVRQTDLMWSEWTMLCQIKGINPNNLKIVRRREITAQMNTVKGVDGQNLNINTEASISEIVKRLSPTKQRGNFEPVTLRPYGTPGVTREEGAYFDLISSSVHVDRVYKLLDDHPSLGDKTITEIKVISKEHSPAVDRTPGNHLEITLGPKDSVKSG